MSRPDVICEFKLASGVFAVSSRPVTGLQVCGEALQQEVLEFRLLDDGNTGSILYRSAFSYSEASLLTQEMVNVPYVVNAS